MRENEKLANCINRMKYKHDEQFMNKTENIIEKGIKQEKNIIKNIKLL